jgi:hypothetical protein
MRMKPRRTAELGDLIVAAFDKAAQYSTDPQEVTRLATKAVVHMLRRARRASTWRLLPSQLCAPHGAPQGVMS